MNFVTNYNLSELYQMNKMKYGYYYEMFLNDFLSNFN